MSTPEPDRPRPPRYARQLQQIAGLARRFHELLGRSLDLNASSLDAMDWLIRDGALTPTEISTRLGISPGATTSVVRRLEQTGHARRVEHDADRRSVRMVAAEESVEMARERLRPLVAALEGRVGRYSEEELDLVSRFLDDVVAAYREGVDVLEAEESSSGEEPTRREPKLHS